MPDTEDMMIDDADDAVEDSADGAADGAERDVATLVAGGLLGAALGAGLGLLLSRAAAPPAPAPTLAARRGVARTRRVVSGARDELDEFATRVERELRALRRAVKRQGRRGWLR
jgi:hypothetical protein